VEYLWDIQYIQIGKGDVTLMLLFGGIDIPSFVRIHRLNW
jgi:hypothetical protein